MINSFKNLIDNNEILNEIVEREILEVKVLDIFIKEWSKISKNSITNVKYYLMENFNNDLINTPLHESKFSKKYKNLNKARKLRWNSITDKKSKNGDIRIISTYNPNDKSVYLLLCYSKKDQKDINERQAKILDSFIEILRNGGEINVR